MAELSGLSLSGLYLSGLASLWLFILWMVATPGPANMLVMMAGARSGWTSVFLFVLGLVGGKILLNLAMGLGLLVILQAHPQLVRLASWLAAGYFVWLAMKGWNGLPVRQPETMDESAGKAGSDQAVGFWPGLLVHPLNPKAWLMVIVAWGEFGPPLGPAGIQMIVIPASFALVQLVCHSGWAAMGYWLNRHLSGSLVLHRVLTLITLAVIGWAVIPV